MRSSHGTIVPNDFRDPKNDFGMEIVKHVVLLCAKLFAREKTETLFSMQLILRDGFAKALN